MQKVKPTQKVQPLQKEIDIKRNKNITVKNQIQFFKQEIPDVLKNIGEILNIIYQGMDTSKIQNDVLINKSNELLTQIYNCIIARPNAYLVLNSYYFKDQWYIKNQQMIQLYNEGKSTINPPLLCDETCPIITQLTVLPSISLITYVFKSYESELINQIFGDVSYIDTSKVSQMYFDMDNLLSEGVYVFDKDRLIDCRNQNESSTMNAFKAGYFIKTKVRKGNNDTENQYQQACIFYKGPTGTSSSSQNLLYLMVYNYQINPNDNTIIKESIKCQPIKDYGRMGPINDTRTDVSYLGFNQPSIQWPIVSNHLRDGVDHSNVYLCFNESMNSQQEVIKHIEYVFKISFIMGVYPYSPSFYYIVYGVQYNQTLKQINQSYVFQKMKSQDIEHENIILTGKTQQEVKIPNIKINVD